MSQISHSKELDSTPLASEPIQSKTGRSPILYRVGYAGLLLLVFSLPFELTQRPFFSSPALVLNNLRLILYFVAILATLSLAQPLGAFLKGLVLRKPDPANFFYRWRLAFGLMAGVLLLALISSLLARDSAMKGDGLKWTVQFLVGGLVWTGMVLWLQDHPGPKIHWLGLALVTGAVISAIVGFMEIVLGMDFARSLDGWFKQNPTVAGPYLRLSGTFEYANITAMYFEVALPFALAGFVAALTGRFRWQGLTGWLVVIVILLEALFLTLSRGAWLGLGISLAAMALGAGFQPRSGRQQWWLALGLTAGLGLGLSLFNLGVVPQFALRLNGLSDQEWYQAAYRPTLPASLKVCQQVTVPVTVENRGLLDWEPSGTRPFMLSYHWLYPSGQVAVFEGARTVLPSEVAPGGVQTIQAILVAPPQPGQYLLVWDMVQEETSWFSVKSGNYSRWPVQVEDLPSAEKNQLCAPAPAETISQTRPTPPVLPTVQKQPGRDELWKAALKMIAARPLTGVGPNGYRLNYGYFASPPLAEWDTQIFANSLPLEIFADLGLLGGLCYIAFFGALGWPLLKAFRQHNGLAVWQIAVIGAIAAFLGHGLVDYILGSHAINILFWVVFGLASLEITAKSNRSLD
jgi:hypothetical protein